jgi:hypothetical protein
MLIQSKSIQKTIIAGILFISSGLNLLANIHPSPNSLLSNNRWILTLMPDKSQNGNIDFQINSEVNYLNISQFIKSEARQFFLNAKEKENEVLKINIQTDSLRNAYANSPSDQQGEIAALILGDEKKISSLNEEIPGLYEKARSEENRYWQGIPAEEKDKLLAKINHYKDSVQQASLIIEQKVQNNKTVPDTITYYRIEKKTAENQEPVSALVYKIQVGAFRGRMSESSSKTIKKLELLRKVENYKDEKGITIYTTGNLKTYQEALTLLAQVKLEGIKTASVTAYNNGKKIPLEEAKKISNEVSVKP